MEAEAADKVRIVGDQLPDTLSKLSESQPEVKHLNEIQSRTCQVILKSLGSSCKSRPLI